MKIDDIWPTYTYGVIWHTLILILGKGLYNFEDQNDTSGKHGELKE